MVMTMMLMKIMIMMMMMMKMMMMMMMMLMVMKMMRIKPDRRTDRHTDKLYENTTSPKKSYCKIMMDGFITPPRNRGGIIFLLQFVCLCVCVCVSVRL